MTELHLDFETRSAVDITKAGAEVYARHPTTDIMCMAVAFDDHPVRVATTKDELESFGYWLIQHIAHAGIVIAHNAAFELAIWNNVGRRYGWPELRPEQMICTMAMAYAMSLPGSLDNASAAVGIDQKKDMHGRRVMLQLSKPKDEHPCPICEGSGREAWPKVFDCPPPSTTCKTCHGTGMVYEWIDDAAKFETLYAYCKQDVEVERALYKRMMKLSPDEHRVWVLDQKINGRGIRVDLDAVKKAIAIVEIEQARLNAEMKRVTENQVGMCTAVGQLIQWLKFRGVPMESVDKPSIAEALERTDLPDDVRAALLLRQEAAKSSTAKLEAMVNSVCADGRIRGALQYHAAGTGRWGGRLIQPQNLPRPTHEQSDIEEVFQLLGRINHV